MLDPGCAAEVRGAVAGLTRRDGGGPTLVVVEHVLGPWVDLVERLVVLDRDGTVAADGPVAAVLAAESARLLHLGIWLPGAPPPVPVPVPPGLLDLDHRQDAALRAAPFGVDRTTRLLDGTTRAARAAELAEPLTADPGSLSVLVGPSGSGKSTLLHALAGFLPTIPTDAVRVVSDPGSEADPAALDPRALAATLAWVPQWASLDDRREHGARRGARDLPRARPRRRRGRGTRPRPARRARPGPPRARRPAPALRG